MTEKSTEQERQAFEAWARQYGTWDVVREDCEPLEVTGYTDATLNVAWHAVQAARREPAVPNDALLTLETDAHYIFNDPPSECPRAVRDVIEWYASSVRALLAAAPQPPEAASKPDAYRADVHVAECIDDHCTGCCDPSVAPDFKKIAADVLAKRAEATVKEPLTVEAEPVQPPESSSYKCPTPDGYQMPDEPQAHDGHDYEGFPGGCKRLGCAPK